VTLAILVLSILAGGDTVVLKEKAKVSGRYVRLADLVDADRTGDAARAQAAEIYLGRSPEEGQARVVTLDEIRRELERRGVDPDAFTFVGREVEVTRSGEGPLDALRRAIAFEIKRHVLELNAGGRADETVIRLLSLHPENVSPDCDIAEIRARGASDFTVVLVDPSKKRIEVEVVARVLRTRDIAFAAREINPGKTVERADLELRRVESSDDESASGELVTLVGATATVRIRKGAKVSLSDLKLKAVVRKGDIVRACSSTYEVDARALEDGAPAQEISLEFVTSKNRLRAKVAGSARVEVVEVGK
jgi:flagella basal body P-ring formation protein FlgA